MSDTESPKAPPLASVRPIGKRTRDVILIALVGLLAFFVARTLIVTTVSSIVMLSQFGLHSPTEDFDFLPFLLMGLLAFSANGCLCCALGMISHRVASRLQPIDSGGLTRILIRRVGLPLAILATWLLIFNLPRFLPVSGGENRFSFVWPPETFYSPIRLRLLLFYPLGNLGAATGFILGLLLAETRSRKTYDSTALRRDGR